MSAEYPFCSGDVRFLFAWRDLPEDFPAPSAQTLRGEPQWYAGAINAWLLIHPAAAEALRGIAKRARPHSRAAVLIGRLDVRSMPDRLGMPNMTPDEVNGQVEILKQIWHLIRSLRR